MQFVLMKKNQEVLIFSFSADSRVSLYEILDITLLPVRMQKENLTSQELKQWLSKRCISSGRSKIDKLLKYYNVDNLLALSIKSMCLTLSDSYWIKPTDSSLNWQDVNFFDNGYTDNIGNFIIRDIESDFELSPDFTTNGVMEKSWRRKGQDDYLFKLGKGPFHQEPYNEVICSQIAAAFPALNAVEYHLSNIDGNPCSVCKNFLNSNTDFIPASYLLMDSNENNAKSYYGLLYKCKELRIPGVKEFIDNMIAFDYLICNSDRHLGNFGFIQNNNSGIYIGPAPLFDSGNSLWHDESISVIANGDEFCKPFAIYHEEQIQLVKSFEHISFPMLKDGINIIYDNLEKAFDEKRASIIAKQYTERINMLYQHREKTVQRHNVHNKKRENIER